VLISTPNLTMLACGFRFEKINGLDLASLHFDMPVIRFGNKITYEINSLNNRNPRIAASEQFSNLFLDRVPPKTPFRAEFGCFRGIISGGLSGGNPAFKRLENINNVAGIRLSSKAGYNI
jgi:hypothetical protein